MSRVLQAILVIGILLIAVFFGFAIFSLVDRASQPAIDLTERLATQQAVVFPEPTPTIYPDGAAIVRAVAPLARLESVQYSIEKVIVAETNQGAFAFLTGDRLLLVAHGTVIAGVDLSKLEADDIEVYPDGRVVITVPAAEIFIATLDNDKTYVYDRDTGIFSPGNINLETEARRAAEDQIEEAALEDGILDTAQINAEAVLTQLVLGLGFEEVVFIEGTPTPD